VHRYVDARHCRNWGDIVAFIGGLVGAVLGSVFFGGLLGWIIHKLLRLPYSASDAVALLVVVFGTGFTNASPSRPMVSTWLFYFVAAIPAYLILRQLRRSASPALAVATAGDQPPPLPQTPRSDQTAVAAQMQLEEEIALSVRTQSAPPPLPSPPQPKPKRSQNIIARHWRGELPLPVSYWLVNFAVNLGAGVAVLFLSSILTPNDGYEPAGILAFQAFIWTTLTMLAIWQVVGLWRSAERRAGEQSKARRSAFWARAAQVMAAIGVLQFGLAITNNAAPQFAELSRIVFLNDPDIPDATLRLSDDARFLVLDGGIKYGLAGQVDLLLGAAPNVTGLLLSSPGGRVAEARKIFDLVRERGLDTFVSDECSSACTLVFVAGRNRLVGQNGRLGFHGSFFPGMSEQDLREMNDAWASLYRSAGLSGGFLDRALRVPPESIWYPTREELREAGVTLGDASKLAALPDGFTAAASLASVRETLLAASGLYEAIDTHAPDQAARIYARGLDYAEGKISVDALTSEVNGIIIKLVTTRLSRADDQTLVQYALVAADEYDALRQLDTTACFHYASGTQQINLKSYISPELAAREAAVNERIVRSVGTAPSVTQTYLDSIWGAVGWAMRNTLTQAEFDAFMTPVEQITPSEHEAYCIAATAMMRELAKLPPHEAATAIRSFYQ